MSSSGRRIGTDEMSSWIDGRTTATCVACTQTMRSPLTALSSNSLPPRTSSNAEEQDRKMQSMPFQSEATHG